MARLNVNKYPVLKIAKDFFLTSFVFDEACFWILHSMSCFQIADIREFEEFADTMPDMEQYPLYQSAIRHLEENPIPVRTMRTELVNCSSDLEYLAKLHCIRLAFQYLFKVSSTTYVIFCLIIITLSHFYSTGRKYG